MDYSETLIRKIQLYYKENTYYGIASVQRRDRRYLGQSIAIEPVVSCTRTSDTAAFASFIDGLLSRCELVERDPQELLSFDRLLSDVLHTSEEEYTRIYQYLTVELTHEMYTITPYAASGFGFQSDTPITVPYADKELLVHTIHLRIKTSTPAEILASLSFKTNDIPLSPTVRAEVERLHGRFGDITVLSAELQQLPKAIQEWATIEWPDQDLTTQQAVHASYDSWDIDMRVFSFLTFPLVLATGPIWMVICHSDSGNYKYIIDLFDAEIGDPLVYKLDSNSAPQHAADQPDTGVRLSAFLRDMQPQ